MCFCFKIIFVNADVVISDVFFEDNKVNSTDLLVNLVAIVSGYSFCLWYDRSSFSAATLPSKKVSESLQWPKMVGFHLESMGE